ncbi:hypothetical protein D9M70_467140 [compost metagenome]
MLACARDQIPYRDAQLLVLAPRELGVGKAPSAFFQNSKFMFGFGRDIAKRCHEKDHQGIFQPLRLLSVRGEPFLRHLLPQRHVANQAIHRHIRRVEEMAMDVDDRMIETAGAGQRQMPASGKHICKHARRNQPQDIAARHGGNRTSPVDLHCPLLLRDPLEQSGKHYSVRKPRETDIYLPLLGSRRSA